MTIETLSATGKLKPQLVWRKWTTVKLSELYKFFGIILHMCLVKKPKLSDYWSTNPVLQSSFAAKCLPRDRFLLILRMLHLVDNATYIPKNQVGPDLILKVRPIFDRCVTQSGKAYKPGENITIDEGISPFRGRLSFRVYMKIKPHKYGVKFFVLYESGYVLNCEIYSGNQSNADNSILHIVDRLCLSFHNKGHTLYMARFYTSPDLLDYLWGKRTEAVGTVQKNRKGLPRDLVGQKLKKK
ncbi:piggyBac transposable element-derived protein 4-like [Schistocerca serialis cubense]|uniref:piggyBac transposable element-derived protein 4-like n=1 Tax=Schistocerca serialis cubense TaxID=2023355 RepID=UPI00214EA071|nr:piggyBac transposable element-derived protein 4-like [Schistocerca serialis cubense]